MAKDDEVVKLPDEDKPPLEAEPEEPEFKTPEDEEFDALQVELKAEEDEAAKAAGAPETDPESEEGKENEAVAKAAEPEPGAVETPDPVKTPDAVGATDQRMVPIAALHDTRGKLQDSELQRARLEGMLAAAQQQVQQGQPQQPQPGQPVQQQQSPEAQVEALNAQIDALWEKGDAGELSLVEIRKGERVIEKQLKALEAPVNVQQQQAPGPPQLDATIETNLVRLEAEFPVITTLSEVAMQQFVKQAYEVANNEGNPIGEGALETMRLHNLSAKHANDHYAKFFGAAAPAAAAPKTPQTPQPPTTPTPAVPGGALSPAAQARADKMDLAANHPPNINNLGTTAEGQMSDDQIASKMEGMSEDEAIEFLETMPGLAKRLGVTMSGPQ